MVAALLPFLAAALALPVAAQTVVPGAQASKLTAPAPAPAAAPAAATAAAPGSSKKSGSARAASNKPSSRTELRSQAAQMASGISAAQAALSPDELEIASRVYTGSLPCEMGNTVLVAPIAAAPGYFDVQLRGQRFLMTPVATSTGAIRLEDRRAGAVWLQLANKSMLMNQKLGRRMADECMSPSQSAVAQAMRLNPPASVLDAPGSPVPPGLPAPAAGVAALPAPVLAPVPVPVPAPNQPLPLPMPNDAPTVAPSAPAL